MNTNYFSAVNTLSARDRYNEHKADKRDGRSDFAIDRDRILYSKAFRRLSDKTQVFFSDEIKDLRTRLTHTLEVYQIAKTIVTSLGFTNDLTEAIALGHDVGHTPFGHVGERSLNLIMNNCEQLGIQVNDNNLGFKHNLQSVRVLCDLEGELNLSKYTLWGIVNHSKLSYSNCQYDKLCYSLHHPAKCHKKNQFVGKLSCDFYKDYLGKISDDYWSIEGLVVALADEIAQRHHDIEDSIRFKILDRKELLNQLNAFQPVLSELDKENLKRLEDIDLADASDDEFLAQFSRLIIKAYVVNLTEETKKRIILMGERIGIASKQDFIEKKSQIPISDAKALVAFSEDFSEADKNFHNFLKSSILNSYGAQSMDGKGAYIVRRLFQAYMSNPTQLPDDVICRFYNAIHIIGKDMGKMRGEMNMYRNTDLRKNHLMRVIADYIASMTDSYAYNQYDLLYGTMV